MTTGAAADSSVFTETLDSGIVGSAGAATGAREASTELSLVRFDDSVPQPPKATPRTARTISTGQTRELEPTVPPMVPNFATFDATALRLFTHGRETSLKTDATPALFLSRPGMLDGPSRAGQAQARPLPF